MKDKSDLIAILILIVIVACLALMGGHYISKANRLQDELSVMEQTQAVTLHQMDSRLTSIELAIAMQPVRRVVLIDVEDYLKEGAE